MTLPANIRVNMQAPFPALVQGSQGITVTKQNGVWTIGNQSTSTFAVSVQQYGALCNGTTDDSAAFQLALNSGNKSIYVPAGTTSRLASGIIIPQGVSLWATNFTPDNSEGTQLVFDLSVPTCVTLGGAGAAGSASLRGLMITRATGVIPGGSTGVMCKDGYAHTLVDVLSQRHSIGFSFQTDNPLGLTAYCDRIFSAGITDAHIVQNSWPELSISNSRFGSNGADPANCTTYIRISGGSNVPSGIGPNGLKMVNCHFNIGGGQTSSFWLQFVGVLGGGTNAVEYLFTNCHVETIGTAFITSDAGTAEIYGIQINNCFFNTVVPFLSLNAATSVVMWFIVNSIIQGSLTLAPTAAINGFQIDNCLINGAASITGATNSAASLSDSYWATSLTLNGAAWGSLSVVGGVASSVVNNAGGTVNIAIPNAAGIWAGTYTFGALVAATTILSFTGVGYATGAGGTVTQLTSKSTGVTLSKASGAITMNNAALAAGTIVSFVLTNTLIAATDVLVLNHISGGTPGSYLLNAQAAAGSATINVRNETGGSLSEAIVIQFALVKAVNS